MENKEKKVTYIGGQAVLEGVMMRGKRSMATAVRDLDGKIQVEAKRITPPEKRSKFSKLPFVRGCYSFIDSLFGGTQVLMRSAEVFGADEEPSKTEKWLAKKFNVNVMDIVTTLSMILGILLSVGLFFFLPVFVTGLISSAYPDAIPTGGVWYNLIAGGVRIVIFVCYILLTSLLKDIKRTYMYHGAEHKTISCYEYEKELTVENVKTCTRVHDRCGTTFMFLVMVISVLIFALISGVIKLIPVVGEFFDVTDASSSEKILVNLAMFGIHMVFLPVVAGTSYEVLRLLSKSQSKWLLIFKAPGLLLQRITTREPDDSMIECAIAAFKKVVEMDADENVPETFFTIPEQLSTILTRTKKLFKDNGIEEDEAEWICSIVLDIPKSSLSMNKTVGSGFCAKISEIVNERLTGRPLWYIIGDTSFCGYTIKVDERVLIPRPETEELVEYAGKTLAASPDFTKVLDLCTGSGAVAIAIKKRLPENSKVKVIASDISEDALTLAAENAKLNEADIDFKKSNLFSNLRGKYHLIVSNPPYIKSDVIETLQREVKDHEPRLALDGGKDGLDIYRRIAEKAPAHLYKGGVLLMECGEDQAKEIVKMFPDCEYSVILRDFNNVERFVKIVV